MQVLESVSSSLKQELHIARAESDRLFGILTEDALYERPIAQRHRVLFYIGHLEGFDSIQICREGLGLASPDSKFDSLFQAGIDPDAGNLPTDQPSDWPTLRQVRDYVDRCRQHVDAHIDRAPVDTVVMAVEHRQMHLETLAYMFHNFAFDTKMAIYQDAIVTSGRVPANSWCTIPAGEAVLGKNDDAEFGWDNEYDELRVPVPEVRIQKYSITNGEYLKFVEQGADIPHFWKLRDGVYCYRGMFSEIPLPLDWPVYVTQRQATAYAAWLGKTLPSEAQFHRAAYGTTESEARAFPWGNQEPAEHLGNFDMRRWDPLPVDANPGGDSAFGVSQMVGNGWQWTSSVFGPFPGFKSRATYPGYSSNFFDGEHFVIKGGSPRTAARLLRASFRNWFRPDYAYTYSTFRCVENCAK